jgi:hypothetical protein
MEIVMDALLKLWPCKESSCLPMSSSSQDFEAERVDICISIVGLLHNEMLTGCLNMFVNR